MKYRFLLIFLLAAVCGWGQTVIFSENMGTSASNGQAINDYTGFQNFPTIKFSGSAVMRNSSVSGGYTGASGGINVAFGAFNLDFIISDLDISSYTDVRMSFGLKMGAGAATNNHFKISYSSVGESGPFIDVPVTLNGGANWTLYTTGIIPNNVKAIRFLRNNSGTNGWDFRLDDIKLTGELPAGNTVTFHANGGTGTMANQSSSGPANLNLNTFTRTGYSFANWHTTESGIGGTSYTDEEEYDFSADMDLYAQWSINQYNLSYNLNGGTGTVPATQTGNYNTTLTIANDAGFSYPGYIFTGWNTAANGSGTTYASGATYTIPANDNTLYAQWQSTAPSITTTGTISAMNTTYGTASDNQNFGFNAINLSGTQLTVTAPSGFEIATTSGGTYATSLNYTISGGSASGTVYIRLAATTAVGTYSGSVSLSDSTTSATVSVPNSNVTAKSLTITGLSANNKVYDGNTSATITGTPTYDGLVNGETFAVTGTVTWAFSSKNFGTSINIIQTGNYNAPSPNYTVTQPTLTANIDKKALSISDPSIASKVYDGNTTTGTVTPGTLSGLVGSETLGVSAIGTFTDNANVGTNKPASIVYTLSNGSNGGLANNYSLANGTGTGDITKANPVITTSPININVGGTYSLPGANITSTSGGAFTYSITGGGHATYDGNITLNGISVGTEILTVNQAATANYNAGSTTVAVNVSTIAYVNGDYRSINNGNWHSTANNGTPNTWQQFNGSTWENIPNSPPSNSTGLGTKKVYIQNVITLVGSNTAPNVIVLENGELHTSTVSATFGKLLIKSGGEFYREGNGSGVSGDFEIEDNGTVYFYHTNTTSRSSSIWAGTEKFHPNSNFVVKELNNTSNFLAIQTNNDVSEFNGACFGNFIIDLEEGQMQMLPSGFNKVLAHNLILRKNTGNMRLSNDNYSFTILENVIIENNYSNTVTALNTSGTASINIHGNLIYNGTSTFRLVNNTSGNVTINIDGNIEINSGTLDLNFTSGGIGIVNLKGDLFITPTANLIANNATTATFNFTGTGDGLTPETTQTIDIGSTGTNENRYINFNVKSGAYVQLINRNFELGTNSNLIVENGGTFDFGFNGSTALNISQSGSMIGQSFETQTGSTLKITSPAGINATGTNTGNVQVPTRTYSPGGIYHYIGKGNQTTGNGIASSSTPLTGRIIVELETPSLELQAFDTRTISSGTLEILKGIVLDDSDHGFVGSGNLVMNSDDGRYITSRTGTQPELTGNYTLTAGTVEFANTSSSAEIRVTPEYNNIDISGTNIISGGKDLIVNNLVKVITPTGKLTIPSTPDTENPYVLTAREGVQVATGGQLILENNANLMQNVGAVNTGGIVVERFVQDMNNILPDHMDYVYWSSPVNGQQIHDGTNSIFSPGTPKNRNYQYNESNDYFIPTPDLNFIAGKGYAIRAEIDTEHPTGYPGYDETYSFTGVPNNGLVNISIQKSPDTIIDGTTYEHGYNLVGNPYPSSIDADVLFEMNASQIEPYIELWTNNTTTPYQSGSSYTGNSYAIYNLVGGNPAGIAAGEGDGWSMTEIPNGIIKPGQGFLIKAKEGANQLIFNNNYGTNPLRVTEQGYFFQKTTEKDRFWIEQTSPLNMIHTALVGYVPGATNEYEKELDVRLPVESSDAIYTLSEGEKYAIQGRAYPLDTSDVVPLGLNHFEPGIYKIGIRKTDGIFNQQPIYLKDNVEGITHNLSEQGEYYYVVSNDGELKDRFEIVYEPDEVMAVSDLENGNILIYKHQDDIIIKSKKDKLLSVKVFDLAGSLVYRQENINSLTHSISAKKLNTQIIIINVQTNTGEVLSKKFINK